MSDHYRTTRAWLVGRASRWSRRTRRLSAFERCVARRLESRWPGGVPHVMIPCTDNDGLRDYREPLVTWRRAWPRWPWLVLLAFLLGLAIGEWR